MNLPKSSGPTDADVERVVVALRSIDHESSWQRVLEVGRLVFEVILEGDENEWRSHRGKKNVSLRQLVDHPGCPFKKSALCTFVNIHLFTKSHPVALEIPGITPTHVAQTLGLNPQLAIELLRRAASNDWSVRALGQEARLLRKEAGERRGRPIASTDKRALTVARRAATLVRELREQLGECSTMSDDSFRSIRRALADIRDLVDAIHGLPAMSRRLHVVLPLAKGPALELDDVATA